MMSFCEGVVERGVRGMENRQMLLRATNDRMLWRNMISNILKARRIKSNERTVLQLWICLPFPRPLVSNEQDLNSNRVFRFPVNIYQSCISSLNTYVYVRECVWLCMFVCARERYACDETWVWMCTTACEYMHACEYICLGIYVYTCVRVWMY